MWGTVDVFAKDKSMKSLSTRSDEAHAEYNDPSLIGFIIGNHDLPRFGSLASDDAKIYNALALQHLWGGIPVNYYGDEAGIKEGSGDPQNRVNLWKYTNYATEGEIYKRIARLNLIRKKMGELGGYLETIGTQVALTDDDIAFTRNGLLVLTKVNTFLLLVLVYRDIVADMF